jgi:5'-deoxynucleotidase YfbR-like HD superfamily hydrolase
MQRLNHQLQFVAEVGRLRGVLRQTTLADPARRENSAEHSWHLTVLALALAEYAPPGTDLARVVAMLAVHDVVEVDAGDLSAYAPPPEQNRQLVSERAAADRLFSLLPADQAGSMRTLWDEFEERATPEAKFARALDRLQPMLENVKVGGGTWRQRGITAADVMTKVALIEDGSPELGKFARDLVGQAVRDGILAADPGQADK